MTPTDTYEAARESTGGAEPREGREASGALTRRDRKKARTRAQIFEAAMGLFGERGYAAATIEQICARADVARGTFFLHFASKPALLLELDRALASELRSRFAEPRASGRSELRVVAEGLVEAARTRGPVVGTLLRELLSAQGSGALHALARDVVRRGQERGEFRRGVPDAAAALQILASCAAAAVAPADARSPLLQTLLHGLAEPKPRLKWTRAGVRAAR
ncbi:MAG TPA: TetR/AcrR family transcriptional regulator [Myxococcota bacterium]